jgi:2-haloacid dehalogenase
VTVERADRAGGVGAVFFDLFGTLLPLGPLDEASERLAPGRGYEVAVRWRARQLEATWLRTIMDRWVDLDVITRDALVSTLEELGLRADEAMMTEAAGAFARLPIDPAAAAAVRELRAVGLEVGILTNASRATVDAIVARLGLGFDHVLSVDAVRRFKPHPSVYQLAVDAAGLAPGNIGFVTSNGWDAAGAGSFGLRVAWLRPVPNAVMPAVDAPAPITLTWAQIPGAFRAP